MLFVSISGLAEALVLSTYECHTYYSTTITIRGLWLADALALLKYPILYFIGQVGMHKCSEFIFFSRRIPVLVPHLFIIELLFCRFCFYLAQLMRKAIFFFLNTKWISVFFFLLVAFSFSRVVAIARTE